MEKDPTKDVILEMERILKFFCRKAINNEYGRKNIIQNKDQVVNLIFAGGDRNYDERVKVFDCFNINTPFSDEILLHEKISNP